MEATAASPSQVDKPEPERELAVERATAGHRGQRRGGWGRDCVTSKEVRGHHERQMESRL